MPIKVAGVFYKKFRDAVKAVKKNKPGIKDPKAYVGAIEATIEGRRKKKKTVEDRQLGFSRPISMIDDDKGD